MAAENYKNSAFAGGHLLSLGGLWFIINKCDFVNNKKRIFELSFQQIMICVNFKGIIHVLEIFLKKCAKRDKPNSSGFGLGTHPLPLAGNRKNHESKR